MIQTDILAKHIRKQQYKLQIKSLVCSFFFFDVLKRSILGLRRLKLRDQKYSENCNIVKYDNLKQQFSILIYHKTFLF